jgi:carbamoyltransferase
MNILSFNDGHNASAALLIDGTIRSALQEERLTRIKNQPGFPALALDYVLNQNRLSLSDIDHFVFAGTYLPLTPHADRDESIRRYKKEQDLTGTIKHFVKQAGVKQVIAKITQRRRKQPLLSRGVPSSKISFADHHTCHAASAYFCNGVFDRPILVLTNDGAGDDLSATVSVGTGGALTRISSAHMDASVGEIWAVTTALMGMVPLEHEYKLMGMAPYAPRSGAERVKQIYSDLYAFDATGLSWHTTEGCPPIPMIYNFLRDRLEFMRFDWICAGLQDFTEEFLVRWVERAIEKTGIKEVALSGGTFMNVKANKRILELPGLARLFVVPSCGDETNALGAAYLKYFSETGRYPEPLGPLYLGTGWDDVEIFSAFNQYSFQNEVHIEHCPDIEKRTAELIAEGHVVARFHGREEFGARALGARSILADPMRLGVIKEINDMIKSRDFWMPFAASILDSDEERYLVNPKKMAASYMIMTFDSRNTAEIAAGTHPYDGTCRPQVVSERENPSYYRLISEFKAITGRGAVLNTSLNLHGLPIASSPRDCFHVLDNSGLKLLAIGSYLVRKGA